MMLRACFPAVLCGAMGLAVALAGCDSGGSADEGGQPAQQPPPAPAYFDEPAWHPAGRYIAAEHADSVDTDNDGRKDEMFGGVWLVDALSGQTQPLLRGYGAPAWSPDGRRLAAHRGGQVFTIEVRSLNPARADTTTLRQLTAEGANFFPAWSPDGEWIAYDSNVQNPAAPYEIWKMRSGGAGRRNISGFSSRMPSWSPDGAQIVHIRYATSGGDVAVVDSAGGSLRSLTNDAVNNDRDAPKYAPRGNRIAFVVQRDGPAALWIMALDGAEQRQVSPSGAWRFDWSPDGQRLVFLFRRQERPPGSGELWFVNADGTGLRQLTHFNTP